MKKEVLSKNHSFSKCLIPGEGNPQRERRESTPALSQADDCGHQLGRAAKSRPEGRLGKADAYSLVIWSIAYSGRLTSQSSFR